MSLIKKLPILLCSIVVLASLNSLAYIPSDSEGITIEIALSKNAYLTSESIKLTYFVYLQNGEAPDGGEGSWILSPVTNNTVIFKGNLSTPSGTITIPLDTYNFVFNTYEIRLNYTYNNLSAENTVLVTIVPVESYTYQMYVYPLTGIFRPGAYARVIFSSPVPGLTVKYISCTVYNTTYFNITNPLVLDSLGRGYYYFKIPDLSTGTEVIITSDIAGKIKNYTFVISDENMFYFASTKSLNDTFLSGETLSLRVDGGNNGSSYNYLFEIFGKGGELLKRYFGESNSLEYVIPKNYSGSLDIFCRVYNTTSLLQVLHRAITVKYGLITVYFDKPWYTANTEIKCFINFKSFVMNNATFIYNIYADFGSGYVLISSITTQGASIDITVPKYAPQSYKVIVYAVEGVFFVSSFSTINLGTPVGISAYILTQSAYVTGVFTPGQEIEIKFTISGEFLENARLYYGFADEFYTNPQVLILNNKTEGTITVVIPQNARTGIYEIHLLLVYSGGEKETGVFINVNDNPAWTNYKVFLDIPLGSFIPLIGFIIISVVMGVYFLPKKKSAKERSKNKLDLRKELP